MRPPRERAAAIVGRAKTSACWLGVVVVAGGFADALAGGPLTRWHHARLIVQARAADLIGRPESVVVQTFGSPTSVSGGHPGPAGEVTIGYDYSSIPLLDVNPLTVWVRGGRVLCVESFDREFHELE